MDGKLTREERQDVIARLQFYFQKERDEELGDLAAALLVDFLEREVGPYFHNQGVRAAKAELSRVFDAVGDALDVLERRPKKR